MRLIDILDSVKRGKKTKFIAGFITVLIIAMIIFSGPASAITVNLTLESDEEDSLATGVYDYKAVVDIHTNDAVPLDLVYIKLTNTNSSGVSNCYFNLITKEYNSTYSTENVTDICSKISISNITNNAAYTTSYGYNYGYGYGDGLSPYDTEGLNNVSWNYGYGYGYANGYGYDSFTENLSTTGEVTVLFRVNSSNPKFTVGNTYSIRAGIAGLKSGAVEYTYYNKDSVTFIGKGFSTNSPATVDLGEAANFVVLSSTAITSLGAPISVIIGDIGVSPAAGTFITDFTCTGSVPTSVTGTIHVVSAGGPTLNCQTVDPDYLTPTVLEYEAAYTDASGRPIDATITTALDGLTYTPGVYTAANLDLSNNNNVTLDCQGNADGVLIFITAGHLAVGTNANVVLTGGCVSGNIFWAVAGTTNILGGVGTESTFEGTVLGGQGTTEISLGVGSIINGRLMSDKTISLLSNTITIPGVFNDTTPPVILNATTTNIDNFYSVFDNIVNITANITDTSTPLIVTANFSNISTTLNCGNGNNAILNLTLAADGLYKGSCDISSAITAVTTITPKVILVVAVDSASTPNVNTASLQILVHNLDVPTMQSGLGPGGCNKTRFGSDTTNFTEELDFSNINFIIDTEANFSCISNNQINAPNFRDVNLINMSSIDLSTQESAAKLRQLPQNLQINITPPKQFGNSRIYINSTYFVELNTTTVISFFDMPFTTQPAITPDAEAAGLSGTPVWVSNGYDSTFRVKTGNLTFTVLGFSGYDIGDIVKPLITINAPLAGYQNTSTPIINVTLNGTGSEISAAYFFMNNQLVKYFNSSENNANCNNTAGSEIFNCVFTSPVLGEENKNLTIYAYDTGGSAGNMNASQVLFTVDTIAPIITIVNPTTGAAQNKTINASTSDGTLTMSINAAGVSTCDGNLTFVTYASTIFTAETDNTKTICYRANDTAGNIRYNVSNAIAGIDKTVPAFGNVSNITLYTNTSVAHNFVITDASAILSNLSSNGNFSMNASGYFRNITALAAGETYQVTVTAVDAALNIRQATIFVTALDTDAILATNATTTITNGTTEVVFNQQSSNVTEIVIPDTIPEDTEITLDMGALLNSSNQVEISNNITLSREGDTQNYSVLLQEGTIITGNGSWDGKITLPTVKSAVGYGVSGGNVNVVIELGSSQELNFSKSVKIVMGGMAGKDAGWSRGTTLTAITTDCNSGNTTNVTQPSNINTNSPRECSLDDGEDLTIWTYHFTVFAAYTPVASSTDSTTPSSGGTSGGEFISETDMVDGVSRQLYVGSVLAFNLFGERHSFIITSIKDNLVTVRVSSISQYATLAVGEEKKFDLNADDFYDLLVSVDDITSSRAAIISLKIINESVSAAPVTPGEEEITPTETTPGVVKKINDAMKSPITLIVAAIIIVLAITLSVLYKRNNKGNVAVVSQHHHKHK